MLTLEEAIHKMTGLPAAWLAQNGRGVLLEGMLADIGVFDAEQIRDRSDYTDPHHYSEGVTHLLVNGVLVIENTEMTGATPGRFLERGRQPTKAGR